MAKSATRSGARRLLSGAFSLLLLVCVSAIAAIDLAYAFARLVHVADSSATVVVSGTVIRTESMGFRSATLSKGESRYRVRYRFVTTDGRMVEGTDLVIARHRFQPGDALRISYAGSDPAANRIVEKNEIAEAIFHSVVGGAIVAFDIFALVTLGLARSTERRAAKLLREMGVVESDGPEGAMHVGNLADNEHNRQRGAGNAHLL